MAANHNKISAIPQIDALLGAVLNQKGIVENTQNKQANIQQHQPITDNPEIEQRNQRIYEALDNISQNLLTEPQQAIITPPIATPQRALSGVAKEGVAGGQVAMTDNISLATALAAVDNESAYEPYQTFNEPTRPISPDTLSPKELNLVSKQQERTDISDDQKALQQANKEGVFGGQVAMKQNISVDDALSAIGDVQTAPPPPMSLNLEGMDRRTKEFAYEHNLIHIASTSTLADNAIYSENIPDPNDFGVRRNVITTNTIQQHNAVNINSGVIDGEGYEGQIAVGNASIHTPHAAYEAHIASPHKAQMEFVSVPELVGQQAVATVPNPEQQVRYQVDNPALQQATESNVAIPPQQGKLVQQSLMQAQEQSTINEKPQSNIAPSVEPAQDKSKNAAVSKADTKSQSQNNITKEAKQQKQQQRNKEQTQDKDRKERKQPTMEDRTQAKETIANNGSKHKYEWKEVKNIYNNLTKEERQNYSVKQVSGGTKQYGKFTIVEKKNKEVETTKDHNKQKGGVNNDPRQKQPNSKISSQDNDNTKASNTTTSVDRKSPDKQSPKVTKTDAKDIKTQQKPKISFVLTIKDIISKAVDSIVSTFSGSSKESKLPKEPSNLRGDISSTKQKQGATIFKDERGYNRKKGQAVGRSDATLNLNGLDNKDRKIVENMRKRHASSGISEKPRSSASPANVPNVAPSASQQNSL